ncbi:CCAAT/enhancer-binding protein [Acrasis kona]|uniref:CCAAT/enhancer-binding protein n=1 Tax=Acrasis kona TaxID=1008807 RepID=A0AAW2Z9C8_9EUKA
MKHKTKRSFKAAKKAFHSAQPLPSRKEQRRLREQKNKNENIDKDGVRKPKGVLKHLVDDEEEIEQQKKSEEIESVKWYNTIPTFEGANDAASPTVAQVEELYKKAVQEYENRAYAESTNMSFEEEMLTKGTASDKVAALSLLIAKDPLLKLHLLDQLLSLCKSHSNRVSELAAQTAQDLFMNNLLPKDRTLVAFRENKLMGLAKNLKKSTVDQETLLQVLITKYFEDQLKKKYKEFILIIQDKCENTIEAVRIRGVRTVRDLIKGSHEERSYLLKLLIDKFTDTTKLSDGTTVQAKESKVPTRVMHYLSTLVSLGASGTNNPHYVRDLDRKYVIREATNYLYKTDATVSDKIYCATFLNKIVLTEGVDQELAQIMIEAYMSVCEIQFKNKDIDANLVAAVLAGIYRAYRIAKLPSGAYKEHIDMLFKIGKHSEFNKSLEGLRVLNAIAKESSDMKLIAKYYNLLYKKLLDKGIRNSHKRQSFLILVVRSVVDDPDIDRVMSFVKRLAQTCFYSTPGYTCAVLLVLRDILLAKPAVMSLINQPERLLLLKDEDEEVFDDVKQTFDNQSEIKQDAKPQVKQISDKLKLEGNEIKLVGVKTKNQKSQSASTTQETPEQPSATSTQDEQQTEKENKYAYNPRHIIPEQSGANNSCLWEVNALLDYFHPSAQAFSTNILSAHLDRNYTGNPLDEFSVTHFLDKFMYKPIKQKQVVNKHAPKTNITLANRDPPSRIMTMNSQELIKTPINMVRDDEKFFFKFMKEKERSARAIQDYNNQTLEKLAPNANLAVKIKTDRKLTDKDLAALRVDDDDDDEDDDDDDDASSTYSYTDLRNAAADTVDDTKVDELLMKYASSDDEEEDRAYARGERKKKDFAYDVVDGDIEDSSRPSKDEMSVLLEEGEDELKRADEQEDLDEDEEPEKKTQKKSLRNPDRVKSKKRKNPPAGNDSKRKVMRKK